MKGNGLGVSPTKSTCGAVLTWPFRPAACAAPPPRRLPAGRPVVCWRRLLFLLAFCFLVVHSFSTILTILARGRGQDGHGARLEHRLVELLLLQLIQLVLQLFFVDGVAEAR